MTAYELMIKTNHYLIQGGTLSDRQKDRIVRQLLSARSSPEQAQRFYAGVRFPNNTDAHGRQMYPIFYIPPYNDGKKYKTILNQTPKTHILSANMYELEILRLLHLLAPHHPETKTMTAGTLARLKTTCFGNADDGVGECFDTNLIVIRFLSAVCPTDTSWLQARMDNYNRHFFDKKRIWCCLWYYWLCLSEMPFEIARPDLDRYKPDILNWLTNKSAVMNSDHDRIIHPVLFSILRNNLCRYEEFAYIKDRRPYVSEKDGRLHFDMTRDGAHK